MSTGDQDEQALLSGADEELVFLILQRGQVNLPFQNRKKRNAGLQIRIRKSRIRIRTKGSKSLKFVLQVQNPIPKNLRVGFVVPVIKTSKQCLLLLGLALMETYLEGTLHWGLCGSLYSFLWPYHEKQKRLLSTSLLVLVDIRFIHI
ncbi:hypothetical protein MMC31_001547 [Peltigera leucophlebia]|nr:hypothetical protein [Peltigera leucophlebia]